MKIAIAATGDSLDSQASPVFGRCSHFIIVDLENDELKDIHAVKNLAMMEAGGAGIRAAQTVTNQGVKGLISGAVGPNAFEILRQFGIKIYKVAPGSVEDNVRLYKDGKLEEITMPRSMPRGRGGGRGFG